MSATCPSRDRVTLRTPAALECCDVSSQAEYRVAASARGKAYRTPDFKELGIIQQYGGVLIRLTFLIDAAIIYGQLFIATQLLKAPWGQRYVTLALVCVFVFGVATSFRHFYRSWRMAR